MPSGAVVTVNTEDCLPWGATVVALQACCADQLPTQSTGQTWVLQGWVSMAPSAKSQAEPPFLGVVVMTKVLVLLPPAQGALHSDHSDQAPTQL